MSPTPIEKCLVSQSSSQDIQGPCLSRPLCPSLSAFFLLQHHSYSLWLCLAFPEHLLTSYKLGQIWLLWLNSLHCPLIFILFCFLVSFEPWIFTGSICFWSLVVNGLHPATTPEPLESASLFRVLILLFSQGPVRASSL